MQLTSVRTKEVKNGSAGPDINADMPDELTRRISMTYVGIASIGHCKLQHHQQLSKIG